MPARPNRHERQALRVREQSAAEVMENLREPQQRKVVSFEVSTPTHLVVILACFHRVVIPVALSVEGMKEFLLAATVDCRECAP